MHYKYGFCYTTTYIKTILKKQVNRQIQRKKSFKCPKHHTQKKQLSQRSGISKKQIILDCSLCRTPFYAAVIPRNVGETLGRQEGTLCNPPLFPQLSQNNVISSVLYSNPGFLIRWKEGLRKEFWNLVSEYWNKGVLRGFFFAFLKNKFDLWYRRVGSILECGYILWIESPQFEFFIYKYCGTPNKT